MRNQFNIPFSTFSGVLLTCLLTAPGIQAQQKSSQLAPQVQTLSSAQPQAAPPVTPQATGGLDDDMQKVLTFYDQIKGTHLEALTPQDARQQIPVQVAAKALVRGSASESSPVQSPTPVGTVVDGMTITSDLGIQVPIRLYYPTGGSPTSGGPYPVVLYFHGGGFVVATNDTYDESARALCNYANALVVSVDYRKAPEAPFPAAYKDALHAYQWVISSIGTYRGIPTKVAVAGESAGANLATEVAIYAKTQNIQRPTHQLLIYPLITSNFNQTSDAAFTDSSLPLYAAELPYFANQYFANSSDRNDPRANPLLNDLHNMPATTIIAAQYDPLLSDGMAYYQALYNANNVTKYVLYTGTTHEFFGLSTSVAKAVQAEQFGALRLVDSFR